jgi:LPXTG-site transpeptidase (sortase) family protein
MIISKWGLLAIAFAGALAGLILVVFHSIPKAPSNIQQSSLPKQANPDTPVSIPVRIQIPAIHVDAAIEQVGLANDGSMDVPSLPSNTAWFMLGPRPGEIGSAVIDGHVDWTHGARAVFTDLHNLKSGDKVAVLNSQGIKIRFVVRETRTYSSNAYASDVFASNDGKSHLNLISCQGIWDKTANGFSQRLVVFTDKE